MRVVTKPTEEDAMDDRIMISKTGKINGRGSILDTMEQKFTAHNSESDAITCAECIHSQCPLREFGLEFNRGCYEGRRK
jgi:hypothetical protein